MIVLSKNELFFYNTTISMDKKNEDQLLELVLNLITLSFFNL
jgi:hypothetical protein